MFDAFLQIDGIPGESTDKQHENWIEVIFFEFGALQPTGGEVSTGGSRTMGRVQHDPFRFRHRIDKASPKLFLNCCEGSHISKATLEVGRSSGSSGRVIYYKVEMTDLVVTKITLGGADQDPNLPLEDVEINYGSITWTYTETDHGTGKPKGNVTAKWNLMDNTGG